MKIKDMPYVENYPRLREFINGLDAMCLWQTTTSRRIAADATVSDTMVEAWMVPKTGKMFIVMVYPRRRGFDVFVPSDIESAKTLLEAKP